MLTVFSRPLPAIKCCLVLIGIFALSVPLWALAEDWTDDDSYQCEKTENISYQCERKERTDCANLESEKSVSTYCAEMERDKEESTCPDLETVKLDDVLDHPDQYFGTTVTTEGELHRLFSDKVFSIEDDDFFADDDLLIISNIPMSDAVVALDDSLEDGKDVRVSGVIQPFNRAEMECKYGPLQIESRESHYKEGSPVMIINIQRTAAVVPQIELPVLEKPSAPEPPPAFEPAPEPAPTPPPAPEPVLPKTASGAPMIGLIGLLSLFAGLGIRMKKRY